MIRNLTEDFKFDAECYLYWLHDVSEKDISTEGYVGISLNPDARCRSHESNFQKRRETDAQCSCYTKVWRGLACSLLWVYQYLYVGSV